ncbi:hypothetical protein BO85DRAFT_451739 [Aspergillus piperis CBS 112811]|uniref:Uncharacterized protein n=1 Tax=Aspergillus piperis CBS 112811 TaxID=1448313 RepID=A0A8G1VLM3_9EURO|nr:hypothetical protein BO85DRAFT_451739 [Aspergillus piperis CBS 112811]RAH54863.1 hypothetical protein BO85DRAFT_451739 [Aspergillus piperis CBS 112811]
MLFYLKNIFTCSTGPPSVLLVIGNFGAMIQRSSSPTRGRHLTTQTYPVYVVYILRPGSGRSMTELMSFP